MVNRGSPLGRQWFYKAQRFQLTNAHLFCSHFDHFESSHLPDGVISTLHFSLFERGVNSSKHATHFAFHQYSEIPSFKICDKRFVTRFSFWSHLNSSIRDRDLLFYDMGGNLWLKHLGQLGSIYLQL